MSGVPEHLCEYPWDNCFGTGTHKYQSVTTTKAGEFTYTAELCNEHLSEQLDALAAQFKSDSWLNRAVSITPIPTNIEVSQIGTGK